MTTLYIAGPMSGIEDHNYPAFNAAAVDLRAARFRVLNPVEIEHEGEPGSKPWEWYMRRTLAMLMRADHVATLPGWNESRGATIEVRLARQLGMSVAQVRYWLTVVPESVPVVDDWTGYLPAYALGTARVHPAGESDLTCLSCRGENVAPNHRCDEPCS